MIHNCNYLIYKKKRKIKMIWLIMIRGITLTRIRIILILIKRMKITKDGSTDIEV